MPTNLMQMLDSIEPDHTLHQTSARADAAINTFRFDRGVIDRWDEFTTLMVRFHRHVEAVVLRMSAMPRASHDFNWGRCVHVLMQMYGRNGEKAAFEIARTGTDGGLRGLLRDFARKVAADYADDEISARIVRWWTALSPAEQFAATSEYLARFGHFLPSEMTEGSAARIRDRFLQVLQQHPHLLQRLGNVGR